MLVPCKAEIMHSLIYIYLSFKYILLLFLNNILIVTGLQETVKHIWDPFQKVIYLGVTMWGTKNAGLFSKICFPSLLSVKKKFQNQLLIYGKKCCFFSKTCFSILYFRAGNRIRAGPSSLTTEILRFQSFHLHNSLINCRNISVD